MGKNHKYKGTTFTPLKKCEFCGKQSVCFEIDKDFCANEIIIDCEGFYYIFKRLELFEEYPKINGDLEKHKQDMLEYERNHIGIPYLTPPYIVNGAFAVELALKFLTYREKGEFEYGHNLEKLFNQLPEPHKSILTQKICKDAHQSIETMATNIKSISMKFEEFRYFFEHDTISFSNFFNEFVHIVCDYAISLKPKTNEKSFSSSKSEQKRCSKT